MSAGFPTLPRPGMNTPPPSDWLRLVARQLFEEVNKEHRRGLGAAALRQVEVTATDPATRTATVILGGDVENPIGGVKTLPGYVPRAGDVPWTHQNGSDLLLVGGPGLDLPKLKIRKGAASAITSGDTNTYINFGGTPTVYYDRYGMWNPASPEVVTLPWPGPYYVKYHGHWAEAEGGRRIAEIEDSGGTTRASDRVEWDTGEVANKDVTTNPSVIHAWNAGDWFRVKVFQSSGAGLSILDEPFSNVLEVTYLG